MYNRKKVHRTSFKRIPFSWTLALSDESPYFIEMKFFQLVQTFYRTMGIYPSSSPQCQRDRPTFNFQNLFFLLSLTLMFISSTGYIMLEATSIIEISQTFYVSVSEFACLIQFAITFWKITQMAALIDTIDEFFEKSVFRFTKMFSYDQ